MLSIKLGLTINSIVLIWLLANLSHFDEDSYKHNHFNFDNSNSSCNLSCFNISNQTTYHQTKKNSSFTIKSHIVTKNISNDLGNVTTDKLTSNLSRNISKKLGNVTTDKINKSNNCSINLTQDIKNSYLDNNFDLTKFLEIDRSDTNQSHSAITRTNLENIKYLSIILPIYNIVFILDLIYFYQ